MPKLNFEPARDGYHFRNTFSNSILPGTPFALKTSGLCGGMVMSALDHWRAEIPIPTHMPADFGGDGLPAEASRMRTYIYDRQMNSLLTRLMYTRWIVMPWFGPSDFHAWAVGSEFQVVREQIDLGRPAMLGLWSMTPGDAAGGHQVLCYGYDVDPIRLHVYDPNTPDQESELIPVSPLQGCNMLERASRRLVETYRGYFFSDVYNWNESPYYPHYVDLVV